MIVYLEYIDFRVKVNQTEKQHLAAIDLLKRLGLDNITLERQDGHYVYRAWNARLPAHNGSPPTVRRGKIRARK
jgi:hypothetical protein